jgi:hypothetical protein
MNVVCAAKYIYSITGEKLVNKEVGSKCGLTISKRDYVGRRTS